MAGGSRGRVIVVGGGLGGLATAAHLAHQGWQVLVLEAQSQVGGRLGELRRNGYRFDTGATLLMMLEPLQRFFRTLNRNLEDYLQLILLDPSYRVFFGDGTRFDSSPCIARMVREISEKIDPTEVPGYLRLMADLCQMYHAVIPLFVQRNYRTPLELLHPRALGQLLRYRLVANLWKRIRRYVRDERLRTLFSFQTMYLGLSPKAARWVYAVLTYMESGEGVWYPRGGMYRLVESVARVATEEGVQIVCNAPVRRVLIENRQAVGVRLQTGECIRADRVVLNVDVPTAYRELLPPTPFARKKWHNSCSALMFYIGYRGTLPHLLHHNVFFSPDFERNLLELFEQRRMPLEPSFYVCLSNRTDGGDAPEGCENLYALVPVPNLEGESAEPHRERVQHYLVERVGLDPRLIEFVEVRTPTDWHALGLWHGAAFGIAATFFQSTCFRPAARTPFGNLFFVGASTHPGNGIPMVLLSAELAANAINSRC